MKVPKFVLALVFCGSLAVGAVANDGWGRDGSYTKLYNPDTVKTITGKIVSVNRESRPLKGMGPGFSVVLKDDSGVATEAQVGPAWFTSFYKEKMECQGGRQGLGHRFCCRCRWKIGNDRSAGKQGRP